MRVLEGLDGLDARADRLRQHRSRALTDTVDGENRRAFERRRKIRRRRMGEMMRHEMQLWPQ
jgi:hypothetical protein